MEGKEIKVVFDDNENDVHFVNAFGVANGNGDYFINLGCAGPISTSIEELEKLGEIKVKPSFSFVLTKSSMKRFIELLQSEYEEDEENIKEA
jgi:hypothetical protein